MGTTKKSQARTTVTTPLPTIDERTARSLDGGEAFDDELDPLAMATEGARPPNRYDSAARPPNRYETAARPPNRYETAARPPNRYETAARPPNRYETAARPPNRYETARVG